MAEQDTAIDYSNMKSVSDIRKQFTCTDYTRDIACPKPSHRFALAGPAPPTKRMANLNIGGKPEVLKKPLKVSTSIGRSKSSVHNTSQDSSTSSTDALNVNPFSPGALAERNFILTTAPMKATGRFRTSSGASKGSDVRKSVCDMFDDAIKNAANPTLISDNDSEVKVVSSSGVSMECGSSSSSHQVTTTSTTAALPSSQTHVHSTPSTSPKSLSQQGGSGVASATTLPQLSPQSSASPASSAASKPPVMAKPATPRKPNLSGQSGSRLSSAPSGNDSPRARVASGTSQFMRPRTYSYGSKAYLGSLSNDPALDGLLDFCKTTIEAMN